MADNNTMREQLINELRAQIALDEAAMKELDERISGQAHIAMTDGAGMEPPEGTIFRRFCVTSPKSVLKEAMDRLVACLK